MKRARIIFLLLIITYCNISYSQNKFEIEGSVGFVFFDYFGKKPFGFAYEFSGYGLQTEIDIWKNVYQYKFLQLKVGGGFTSFYYLNPVGRSFISDEDSTPYLNFKLGLDMKPEWSKITFLFNSSNYFLLLKEKERHSQNMWFKNVDLGIRINLTNKTQLSLWSPITIFPMHNGFKLRRHIDIGMDFEPFIEITGLHLGLKYIFINSNP